MKKNLLLIGLFCFLFFSVNVLGVSSTFSDEYSPRETATGKLSGDVIGNIYSSQVKLKRGNAEVAFEFGVRKINSTNYIWFIAPQTPANYTLVVEDVVTNYGVEDYEKNFVVAEEHVEYNVRPGVVFSSEDFEIRVESFSELSQTIDVNFPTPRQVNLNPGINYIDFSVDDVVGTRVLTINIGAYVVPAYIIGSSQEEGDFENDSNTTSECGNGIVEEGEQCEPSIDVSATCEELELGSGSVGCYPEGHANECRYNTTLCAEGSDTPPPIYQNACEDIGGVCRESCEESETETSADCNSFSLICCKQRTLSNTEDIYFEIIPKIIQSKLFFDKKEQSYIFTLKNKGNNSINTLNLTYNNSYFFIIPSSVETILPNETTTFKIELNEENKQKNIREVIFVEVGGKRDYLLFKVEFTTNESEEATEYLGGNNDAATLYYCSELQGSLCGEGETCEGSLLASKDNGICCSTTCTAPSGEGSYAWIGYLIAAIIIIILLFIYLKYKKVKPKSTIPEINAK